MKLTLPLAATKRLAVGAAMLSALGVGLVPNAQAATRLPTPTQVTVSNVQHNQFSLSVGGSTTKYYSVYLNGVLRIGLAESSSTKPIVLNGLNQSTSYSVQVQQVVPPKFLNSSLLSAPRTVTTTAYVAPALPASPAGLAASNVTNNAATISWNAVAGATGYRVYLNGQLQSTVTGTSVRLEPRELYPNGTTGGLTPGQANRVAVAALVGSSASIASQLSVQTSGSTPGAPTSPGLS